MLFSVIKKSFYPELFPFIPLQKWSSCPFDRRMSDGPAFNELIQSTFSWLLPLTTYSTAKHLSWTGWQAFWLKSFNISPVLAILGWCCWQFGEYICIKCQLEQWYKWMMISACDGDAAGWSRSSLLSLLNHYTVNVCTSECVNAMLHYVILFFFLDSHLVVCVHVWVSSQSSVHLLCALIVAFLCISFSLFGILQCTYCTSAVHSPRAINIYDKYN